MIVPVWCILYTRLRWLDFELEVLLRTSALSSLSSKQNRTVDTCRWLLLLFTHTSTISGVRGRVEDSLGNYPYAAHSRRKKKKRGSAKRATQTEAEKRYLNKDLKISLMGSYDHVGVSGSISSRGVSTVLY
jgi:hypothetical protein